MKSFLLVLFLSIEFGPLAGSQTPQFEVASIKPSPGCQDTPRPAATFSPSPGRLEIPCATLQDLMRYAYFMFRDGLTANLGLSHIQGAPHWIQSEYYALSAKSDPALHTEMLAGPMLRALLEERFKLRVHWEKREVPAFLLVIAKGGLKVKPVPEGSCVAIDLSHPPSLGQPQPNYCGMTTHGTTSRGTVTFGIIGGTMAEFSQRLSGRVNRTVVDKTSAPGRYTFDLEYALEASPNPPGQGSEDKVTNSGLGPSIFAALQEQVGVRLVSDKSLVDFLIVDEVEKLTEN